MRKRDKYRVIPLTKGYCAIIDHDDFRKVNKYKWHLHMSKGRNKKPGQPYARANICGKKVYMHRFITGAERPFEVDHSNHQTLDNRRENLNVVDSETNKKNRRNVIAKKKRDEDKKNADNLLRCG